MFKGFSANLEKTLLWGCLLGFLGHENTNAFQIGRKFTTIRNQRQQLTTLQQKDVRGYQDAGFTPTIPFTLPNQVYGVPHTQKENSGIASIYGPPSAIDHGYQDFINLSPPPSTTTTTSGQLPTNILFVEERLPPVPRMRVEPDDNQNTIPNEIMEDELDDLNSTPHKESVFIPFNNEDTEIILPLATQEMDRTRLPIFTLSKRPLTPIASKIRLDSLGLLYVQRSK